jgi:hypothetical protein
MFARFIRRPEVALFVLMLGASAYFYQAGGWNQNSRFDLVRAIVERGTSVVDEYQHNTRDLSCRGPEGKCKQGARRLHPGEHYYCDKAPGMSWLGVPMYGLVHSVWGSKKPSQAYLANAAWITTVWAVGVPSALGVIMLYLLLAAIGVPRWRRAAISVAYGLGTLAFPYATLMYGHQLAAALLLTAFALLVRARRGSGWPAGPRLLFGVGLIMGAAVVAEYPAFIVVAVLCGYAAGFVRPWKHLLWIAAGGAVMALALFLYHWMAFGGPLTTPYEFSVQQNRHLGYFMGMGTPQADAAGNILFTGYRGLFWSAPWLAIGVLGGALMTWRSSFRAEAIVCLLVFALFFLMNTALVDWQGGWAMGPRYLIPAIPFLAIGVAGLFSWLDSMRLPRWLIRTAWAGALALIVYSMFLMLVGTAVKPEVPTAERKPFGRFLLPQFYEGKVAVSTQSIDMMGAPKGKRQAWNLGHKAGLDGGASLVPLGVFLAGAGAWFAWTVHARRREPDGEDDPDDLDEASSGDAGGESDTD